MRILTDVILSKIHRSGADFGHAILATSYVDVCLLYLGAPSLPKAGVLTAYAGKDGKLIQAEDVAWPDYSYGHAELYLTVDDLFRFVQAVEKGELVSKQTLLKLWQPPLLSTGRPGIFATGWEYGESGQYHHVGHDGGTRVRVRMVYKDTLDSDNYIFIYLTNGSVKNVWSRVLLDSAMAAAAPEQFRQEVLSEKLIAYALGETKTPTVDGIPDLERFINASGYALRENLGLNEARRITVRLVIPTVSDFRCHWLSGLR